MHYKHQLPYTYLLDLWLEVRFHCFLARAVQNVIFWKVLTRDREWKRTPCLNDMNKARSGWARVLVTLQREGDLIMVKKEKDGLHANETCQLFVLVIFVAHQWHQIHTRVCTTTPTGVANGLLVKALDYQLKISGPSPTYHWLSCSVVFFIIFLTCMCKFCTLVHAHRSFGI